MSSDGVFGAIEAIGADFHRSADTHMIRMNLEHSPETPIYFKDESTHPSGSLKHRLARSLFLYGLCNGWIREGTPIIELPEIEMTGASPPPSFIKVKPLAPSQILQEVESPRLFEAKAKRPVHKRFSSKVGAEEALGINSEDSSGGKEAGTASKLRGGSSRVMNP